MDRKWTPGEWVVGDEKKVSDIWNVEIICQKGYSLVSTCYGTTTSLADWYAGAREVKANAHLIAAAPDLYEALEGMLRHSCVADAGADMKDAEDHAFECQARAALAKARGEA